MKPFIPTHEQLAYFLTHKNDHDAANELRQFKNRTNSDVDSTHDILDGISSRSRTIQGQLTLQAIEDILKGDY